MKSPQDYRNIQQQFSLQDLVDDLNFKDFISLKQKVSCFAQASRVVSQVWLDTLGFVSVV